MKTYKVVKNKFNWYSIACLIPGQTTWVVLGDYEPKDNHSKAYEDMLLLKRKQEQHHYSWVVV